MFRGNKIKRKELHCKHSIPQARLLQLTT